MARYSDHGYVAMIALMAVVGLSVPVEAAVDRVRTARGSEMGEVTDMTALEVTLAHGSGGPTTVPVSEIKSITFDDEPPGLTQARVNARNGAYENAIKSLGEIDIASLSRDVIRQDVEFYRAYCAARLALGGKGGIQIAGQQLNQFVRSYPNNFHYLEAVETMGNLLMASEKYTAAQQQYGKLGKAPWPDYRARAAVLIARTLQAQNKHAEAIAEFDKVLRTPEENEGIRNEKLSATLGKAASLAATGQVDDAVRMLEAVIRDADPEDKELHARAYNTLGSCYEQAGKTKDALLAFLHVDVLYNSVPDAHAEALSHLVTLWKSVGQEERSREARQTLGERYGDSRWARSAP